MERDKEKIRLVVDTNVLMSALLRDDSFTAKLLKSGSFDLYCPEEGLKEIGCYKKYLISKQKPSIKRRSLEYAVKFVLGSVHIILSELYSQRMGEGYEVMKDIDGKDTPFLALALQLNCPIWSNDRHFKKQGAAKVYTTKEVVELLERQK